MWWCPFFDVRILLYFKKIRFAFFTLLIYFKKCIDQEKTILVDYPTLRRISSAGERLPYKQDVTSSILVSSIGQTSLFWPFFIPFQEAS